MNDAQQPASDKGADLNTGATCSASLESYYRDSLENFRLRLPVVAQQLRELGVARVQIEYDGCGDSGQIESITYLDAEGRAKEGIEQIAASEQTLLDLFYDLTQARHPGWENDEGAFGEFSWDLVADTLQHIHNDRFTDYDTTEHDGL